MNAWEFAPCARIVAEECLALKPQEEFLLLTDTRTSRNLAEALLFAAAATGAVSQHLTYPPREWGEEPPRCVAAAMAAADAVLSLTQLCHEQAVQAARQAGTRIICAFVNEETFLRLVPVDYAWMREKANHLARALEQDADCLLTCPRGSRLSFRLAARKALVAVGMCREPGAWDFLPPGTVVVAPCEGTACGTVVFSGSADPLGRLRSEIRAEVRDGMVVSLAGGDEASRWSAILAEQQDAAAYNIAEFGLGLNPHARLSGDLGEDERLLGQAHLGLGANISLGGRVAAKTHFDAMVLDPTLAVNGRVLVTGGNLLF